MTYKVQWDEKAVKELKKFDKFTATIILKWVNKNLENCENPRLHGKALVGELAGMWRYRVGDYRLLCHIIDEKVIIEIIKVAHRREVYDK